jgi:hypothetical protein
MQLQIELRLIVARSVVAKLIAASLDVPGAATAIVIGKGLTVLVKLKLEAFCISVERNNHNSGAEMSS